MAKKNVNSVTVKEPNAPLDLSEVEGSSNVTNLEDDSSTNLDSLDLSKTEQLVELDDPAEELRKALFEGFSEDSYNKLLSEKQDGTDKKVDEKPAEEEEEEAPVKDEAKPSGTDKTAEEKPKTEEEGLENPTAPGLDDAEEKPKTDEPDPDAEYKAAIEDTSITKKTRSRIVQLLDERKAERERANALAQEKEELAKQLEEARKTPVIPPEELEEATRLRALYKIERDPEVTKKFEEPYQLSNKTVLQFLRERGLNEDTAKLIETHGFDHVSRSSPEWFNKLIGALSDYDRTIVESALADQVKLRNAKSFYIQEQSQNAREYLSRREQQEVESQRVASEETAKTVDRISKWASSVADSEDKFISEKKIPAEFIGEDRELIKKSISIAKERLKSAGDFTKLTPDGYAKLAYDAALSQYHHAVADRAIRQLRAQQVQMKRLQDAGKMPDPSRKSASSPAPSKQSKAADMSFEEFTNRLASGDISSLL